MCVGLRAVAVDAVPQPVGPSGMWVGFFHDEFDAGRLDSRVWRPNRFGGGGVDGPFNPSSEAAAFDPANVSVLGGTLRLVVTAQPATIAGRQYPFRSGTISSQGTVRLRDGDYVEARIRVPRGEGLWPAFWACTENGWPPEIDGFEFFDTARQSAPRFNYHYPGGGQSGPRAYGEASVDYRDSWHTYGWLRRNGALIPYVDGVAYPAAGGIGVDQREYFMIVNLSVFAGRNPLVGSSPMQMEVDWIRAWRPAASATSGPTSPAASTDPSSSRLPSPSLSSPSPSAAISGVVPIDSTQEHSAIGVVAAELRRPAGTATGDLMISALTVNHQADVMAPTGWLPLAPVRRLGTGAVVVSYYRFSRSDDPQSWTWRLSSAESWGGGITSFRGVAATNPFEQLPAVALDLSYRATRLDLPAVAAPSPGSLIVTGFASDSSGPVPLAPAGFDLRWASTGGQVVAVATRGPSDAVSARAGWSVSSARAMATWILVLRPEVTR